MKPSSRLQRYKFKHMQEFCSHIVTFIHVLSLEMSFAMSIFRFLLFASGTTHVHPKCIEHIGFVFIFVYCIHAKWIEEKQNKNEEIITRDKIACVSQWWTEICFQIFLL